MTSPPPPPPPCVFTLVCFSVWLQKAWALLLCLQLCSASSTGHPGSTLIKPYVPVIPLHPLTEQQAPKLLSPPHTLYTPPRQAKPAHPPHMTPLPSQTICSSCQKGERHLTSSEDTTKDTKDIKHTQIVSCFGFLVFICKLRDTLSLKLAEYFIS